MQKKLYEIIHGDNLLSIPEDKNEVIVEGMINKNDYLMIVAEEKIGKTIFAQQLAASLSSGTPFLGIFDIPKPINVWYFATEGRSGDLQDRFIRLNKKVPINTKKLTLIPTVFRFNSQEGAASLVEIVNSLEQSSPEVIIIDALYRAVKGSLRNDDVINDFHQIIGEIMLQLECTVILVHHMTKPQKNNEGTFFSRSDKDTFGSAFLSAAMDQIYWLEKWRKDTENFPLDRMLRCDTQRGGDKINRLRIRLEQPDPLYFKVISTHLEEKNRVVKLLHTCANGLNMADLEFRTRIRRNTLYSIIKELQEDGLIEKYGSKVKFFKLINYYGKT